MGIHVLDTQMSFNHVAFGIAKYLFPKPTVP